MLTRCGEAALMVQRALTLNTVELTITTVFSHLITLERVQFSRPGSLRTPTCPCRASAGGGVYSGDQSREANEHISRPGTNRASRASIYLGRGPIARGERAYTS
eukprot:304795-Pyramimonas_sp.AAC.1